MRSALEPVVGGKQTTLREAVGAVVAGGCSDPMEILASLSETYGQPWLLRQLANVIATIAAGDDRGRRDHYQPVRREPGVPRVQRAADDADALASSVWVEAHGWVPLRDLTSANCRTVADQYGRLAEAAGRHSVWFLAAADVVDEHNALTVGEVRDWLLPAPHRLELPVAPAA